MYSKLKILFVNNQIKNYMNSNLEKFGVYLYNKLYLHILFLGDVVIDYNKVQEEANKYYDEKLSIYNIDNVPKDIEKARLYELVLNILNNKIDGYIYRFKQSDIDFIFKYNVNIEEFIDKFINI